MCNPEDFIRDQFSPSQWNVIPTVLRTAYMAVDDLIKDTPYLQVQSADNTKGRIISNAVDFGIKRAIESGSIKCDYRWAEFARPTGKYLELKFSHSTASVSQVVDPKRQPRNVVFRQNARLNNQIVFDFPEFKNDTYLDGLPHFLLVHGHQTLEFAHLALPSATSKSAFSWRSPNLMMMPHEVHSDLPPIENTDVDLDDLNLIKEDIERWQRDNGPN